MNIININEKGSDGKNIESGHREIQSRDGNGHVYFLRGVTGTEKVIIREKGKKPITQTLKKGNQKFLATNPIITIEYTNDECCEPVDKNVMFTSRFEHRVSTNDNNNNYFENWNCTSCPTSNTKSRIKPMVRQSSTDKVDRCWKTRSKD